MVDLLQVVRRRPGHADPICSYIPQHLHGPHCYRELQFRLVHSCGCLIVASCDCYPIWSVQAGCGFIDSVSTSCFPPRNMKLMVQMKAAKPPKVIFAALCEFFFKPFLRKVCYEGVNTRSKEAPPPRNHTGTPSENTPVCWQPLSPDASFCPWTIRLCASPLDQARMPPPCPLVAPARLLRNHGPMTGTFPSLIRTGILWTSRCAIVSCCFLSR